MNKTFNNKAWFLVIQCSCASPSAAIVPLMTVINYSVQDVLGPEQRVWSDLTGTGEL